jgi:hypothetical protein
MTTGDHLSARTRRRLARSQYAPLEDDDVTQLRVDVLRAPGRGGAVVRYALHVGLIRRIPGEDNQADALAAVGRPSSRSLAA